MKLFIVPTAEGDSFIIADEDFVPKNAIEISNENLQKISNMYDKDDLLVMLISFNRRI